MPYRYRQIAFVSSFPTTPVDGQEILYQASGTGTGTGGNENGTAKSMADLGMIWRFRYNASSSSAYKWETVGYNAPIRNWQTGTHTGLWNYVTVVGNDITIPFNGDYYVWFRAKTSSGGTGWDMQLKACLSSSNNPLTGVDQVETAQGNADLDTPWVGSGRANGLTKNDVIQIKIGNGGGNWNVNYRELLISPIRITP